MSEGKPTWTPLTADRMEKTEMLRVSGGWLYRTILTDPAPGGPLAVALAFQPEVRS